ncbi:MAG: polysaccharide pyruvyl transferase family protein [Burkholderiales bacterium]|nr:polysaccharide pyruvyl transferase family protein [Burkholderiales bacterium]
MLGHDQSHPRTIVISGWYGCGNVGDDALLDAIVAGFRERLGPDTVFRVLTEAPRATAALYADDPRILPFPHHSFTRRTGLAQLLLRGKISPHLKTLRASDLFVLGGGGLIQDANGVGNLFRYLDDCLIAEWLGTPSMAFGIGVSPLVSMRGRWLTRIIGNRISAITTRDEDGAQVLVNAGIDAGRIEATADPALLLEPAVTSAPEVEAMMRRMANQSHPLVVCPRPRTTWSQIDDNSWSRLLNELAGFCDAMRERFGTRVLFVPFMQDDCEVIGQIKRRMTTAGEAWALDRPPRPRDALRLIAHARYVLGMRLHSLIFAASLSIPMISVNYAPKVGSFARGVDPAGATYLERDFRARLALAHLETWEGDYDGQRTRLTALVAPRKAAARLNFDRALALLH